MTQPSVLLIRPREQALTLQQQLLERGIYSDHYSFIDIVANDAAAELLPVYQGQHWHGIIFVSRNAVDYACQWWPQDWPATQYFAVGPGTACYAAKAIQQPVSCPWQQHNSETLLTLPELKWVNQQQWLIVRGLGGRELIADTLRARGAEVHYWQVYQRRQKTVDGAQLLQAWQNSITQIVVTSAEQLGYFLASLPQHALSWLQRCHWIVPGERIAGLIPFSSGDRITMTGSATDSAIIQALTKGS
ncbi:uroporphyrinogen-III synthase [Idiomarina xiamenensis]|uniref:Uroporphyrinogen-III synthase n=1 Tax=Idiomarina xiamenensis 10-D-4 TaxID=740709 RepID=K2KSM2_9GAMM|nr:uroporphyrinogen-III synthase [Idiomarina xiamenensis]EKE80600.1 uroporphyrinogen-III synthase [Idiomarina xiamenensis 10-D-4]